MAYAVYFPEDEDLPTCKQSSCDVTHQPLNAET